jgi:hypothetical protein
MVVLRPWTGPLQCKLLFPIHSDRATDYDAPRSFEVALKLRKDLCEKFCFTGGQKPPRFFRRITEIVDKDLMACRRGAGGDDLALMLLNHLRTTIADGSFMRSVFD